MLENENKQNIKSISSCFLFFIYHDNVFLSLKTNADLIEYFSETI